MEELKKSIVWTDPKMHTSYFKSVLCLCIFMAILTGPKLLTNSQSMIPILWFTTIMLLTAWITSKLSLWKAHYSLKKLKRMLRDSTTKPIKVNVLPQSKLGLMHSKLFNGPGIRKAVDPHGKTYLVPYRDQLENTFEANLYKIGHHKVPYPFLQPYAVIPLKELSKVA